MSNLDKNIIITPNKGHATNLPNVVFTGSNNIATTLNVGPNGGVQFVQGSGSTATSIKSAVAKDVGSNSINVFSVRDSTDAPLFEVMQNGDTVIAGVLTVNGTGESTFAGSVNIGGNLTVDGTIVGGTTVSLAENLEVTGNLVVKGNTSLGDNAATDVVTIKGVTTILSKTTKALGSDTANAFVVTDSASTPLFEVRENGDTVIAGILTVNGTGTSSFAGDVNIGGSLTVESTATVTALMSGTDLTLSGNLIVEGNTDLGNASTDTISLVGSVDTNIIPSATDTLDIGSASKRWNSIYVKSVVAETSTLGDGAGGSTSVAGDIIPATDHVYDLGDPTHRFAEGYISTVNANDIKIISDGAIDMINANTIKVFSIVDNNATTPAELFSVMQNGDTVIGGVLTVNGTGTSTFAGDVSIGGNLNVDGTITGGTQVNLAEDLEVVGNLVVKGNTTLGDDATADVVSINGVTTIHSKTTKALGSDVNNAFVIVDSESAPLFEVRENGDTVIAGILTVNGTGTSSFAGDVSIGGNLTVDGTIVGGTTVSLAENLEVVGNLVVKGNTDLGDADTDTVTLVAGVDSNIIPSSNATYNLGSAQKQWNDVYIGGTLYSDDITATTVTIAGNLTVTGTTTYLNTETITLADNVLVLNSNLAPETNPTADAGIEVNRGSANVNGHGVTLLWDETRDLWTVGAQSFEAGTFIGTFSGGFDAGTVSDLDARYVNVDGDSMTGDLTISGVLSATSKSFVINHPTKPGYKLRYGSLEGPENGVYIRATVKGSTEFVLPDYWVGLVDENSITVNLTANGKFQPLYTVSKSVAKIIVAADGIDVGDLDFDIIVFAERKDVEKIVTEYQEVA